PEKPLLLREAASGQGQKHHQGKKANHSPKFHGRTSAGIWEIVCSAGGSASGNAFNVKNRLPIVNPVKVSLDRHTCRAPFLGAPGTGLATCLRPRFTLFLRGR